MQVPLLWGPQRAHAFAHDCAERVLPIFEAAYPTLHTPRQLIAAVHAFAKGEVDRDTLTAHLTRCEAEEPAWDYGARDPALPAFRAATMIVHHLNQLPWDNAGRARYAMAKSVPKKDEVAAWRQERDWQIERLLAYYLGELNADGTANKNVIDLL